MISSIARLAFALALWLPFTFVARASSAAEAFDPGAELQRLAEARFGPLNRAEQLMVRGAAKRDLVWLGPTTDAGSPLNDPAHGAQWGPDRTVRARIIRWLASDPEAARYVHPSGPGFAGGRVAGGIDFSYLQLSKPITMLGCYIPDGVDFSNARLQAIDLRRSWTGPIDGDSSEIAGEVSMLMGHYGYVSLFRAHIGGSLDFHGAHVSNPDGDSVFATEATIGGDADFHQGFTTDGMVDFRFAKVGHSLSFNDVRFDGKGQNGLNAERAQVAGMIYWVNIRHTPLTILDLSDAHAEGFGDDTESWPAPGNLNLDGFEYGAIVNGPTDAEARLRWLGLQPPGYKPQPYEELAKVLVADGDDSGATQVLIAQRIAQRRFGSLSRVDRLWNLLLEATIGYGYRPLRAVWWMMGFVGFGTVLFATGYRMKVVTPTEAQAYDIFVETGSAPAHYPEFNALAFSVEHFWPFVDLHQGLYWRPNPRVCDEDHVGHDHLHAQVIPARLMRWYLWVHILAGWTLTPLLLAGLSGLIRPG
jgi:hypothetical protein